jgi:hypothetical protein
MKLIRPTAVSDTNLVSSTVPETDHAAWSSGTTYALAARVIKAHRIWESTQASNTNHDPQTAGLSWWVDMGPTNRWGMFDTVVGTETTATGSITIVLEPGRIDALALLQLDAATVTVNMTLAGDTVFSRSISLIDDALITDWFMYFFDPIRPRDYVVITDIAVFGEATTTITISRPTGDVSCGLCVVGQQSDLGGTMLHPSLGINDYSKKVTDDFGNTSLVPRSFSKRMGAKLILNNSEVDRVHSVLSAHRALPIVWIGSDQYSSMLVFGFYRDFEVDIAYVNYSYCTLNIEGMI